MTIPGANVLRMASRAIRLQALQHRAFVSRCANAAGDYVSTFADAVSIQGSMQPVDMKTYQLLGLNFEKVYFLLYTSAPVRGIERDREGDLLTYGGRTFQCENEWAWGLADGWTRMLCVEVPA